MVEKASFVTLVDLLRGRAEAQTDRVAYTYLVEGGGEELSITYGMLDLRARSIAAELQRLQVVGNTALLLYPSGLEFVVAFFACLYAQVVAVPVHAPNRSQLLRPNSRLRSVAMDSGAKIAMTSSTIGDSLKNWFGLSVGSVELQWVFTDRISTAHAEAWQQPNISNYTIAFLQYTSGSTASPKGVMVTHSNLLHNEYIIQEKCDHTEASTFVGWLPLFHDMGLIGNILQPLYIGAKSVLMSPSQFVSDPYRWLETISTHRAVTSGGPNFGYDLCVRKITPEQRKTLDLSCWRVAFNGAEIVRSTVLEQFSATFGECGFRRAAFFPCYGLAEATLMVSGGPHWQAPVVKDIETGPLAKGQIVEASPNSLSTRRFVSCGAPATTQEIAIVDLVHMKPCGSNAVGEIWVSGPCVAQGYWNRPDESCQTFQATLPEFGQAKYLRTGDLGFMSDGHLYVMGRLKDLIIIRGRNYHPEDIEATVDLCHHAVRPNCIAAFSLEDSDEERLVVAAEVERHTKPNFGEIIRAVRRSVATEHGITVHAVLLLKTGALPRTTSGKVQRYVCRNLYLAGELGTVSIDIAEHSDPSTTFCNPGVDSLADTNPIDRASLIENYLLRQAARALRTHESRVNPDDSLISLGLDSLAATELAYQLETDLGVAIPQVILLEDLTIRQLGGVVHELLSGAGVNRASNSERTAAESCLSEGQRALWLFHQLAPESAAYNLARAFEIKSEPDINALRRALQGLFNRHKLLRSNFPNRHGTPIRQVHEGVEVKWEIVDGSNWNNEYLHARMEEAANTPFKLESLPLCRAFLFRAPDSKHILLLVAHHIIADLWSLSIFLRELGILYSAEFGGEAGKPAAIVREYDDYIAFQKNWLRSPECNRSGVYWQMQLAGELPLLSLPLDHARESLLAYQGAACLFSLDLKLTHKLHELSRRNGTTLYVVLLTAFSILLRRYSRQDDILVGSPTAGRNRAEWASVFGYFINLVALRTNFSGNPTVSEMISRTRQIALGALQHQEYPFALLLEKLQIRRDSNRPPLFQALFAFQSARLNGMEIPSSLALGQGGARITLGHLDLESVTLEQRATQFELALFMAEDCFGLMGKLEYSADLFAATTVSRMVIHLENILKNIASEPDQLVNDLSVLNESERRQILEQWNDTNKRCLSDALIPELFEHQAKDSRDGLAIVCGNEQLSYGELNRRANKLANYLREFGVGAESLVAIHLRRRPQMIIAILATLKAGAAYLPLDLYHPDALLRYELDDAKVTAVISEHKQIERISGLHANIIYIDQDWPQIAEYSSRDLNIFIESSSAAYVIYTSGSTAQPKGAIIQHSSWMNLIRWYCGAFDLSYRDTLLLITSFAFDFTQKNILSPLIVGGKLVLPDLFEPGFTSPDSLAGDIIRNQVTVLSCTPSGAYLLLDGLGATEIEKLATVRLLLLGGEVVWPARLQRWLTHSLCAAEVVNMYGPTECTDIVAYYRMPNKAASGTLPIGRPIDNVQLFILDRGLEPIPIGVIGDLYIGGAAVGRAYLNQPEKTAEKFTPTPYGRTPGARFYMTGDLARFLPDGKVEYIGRSDRQVKIRGYRIEIGEIECVLRQHANISDAVVLASEDATGDKQLTAYVVTKDRRPIADYDLRNNLRQKLPIYMLPGRIIYLDKLPLTANGKVDASALLHAQPSVVSDESADSGRPRNAIEEAMVEIWASVLERNISVFENFFEAGGHSLTAVRLMWRVREKFGLYLPISDLFEVQTIAGLASIIESKKADPQIMDMPPIVRTLRKSEMPLSQAQQRLWILQQLNPDTIAYNLSGAIELEGPLDIGALERAVNEIARRHDSLRATFSERDGRPVQLISEPHYFRLPMIDLTMPCEQKRGEQQRQLLLEESRRPCDLAGGPLARVMLMRLESNNHLLVVTMHHIISDGWSLRLWVSELNAFYTAFVEGKPARLPEIAIQYVDFAQWQQGCLQSQALNQALSYWKGYLGSGVPTLAFPTDHPRPNDQSFLGATQFRPFGLELSRAVAVAAGRENVTLFSVLLASFIVLLHERTKQEDIVLGVDIAGRNHQEIEPLIGFFVNTVPLRISVSGSSNYSGLLADVHKVWLGAYAHQDLPLDLIVRALNPKRDSSHNPLFQILFGFQSPGLPSLCLPRLKAKYIDIDNGTSVFDWSLYILETEQGLVGRLRYNTDMFESTTIETLLADYESILKGIVVRPDLSLATLKNMLSSTLPN